MDPEILSLQPSPIMRDDDLRPLAPWWHTLGIVGVVSGMAALSHFTRHIAAEGQHIPAYISQMVLIWLVAGSVVAGLYRRRQFFFNTLQRNRTWWLQEVMRGAAVYIGIIAVLGVVMAVFSSALAFRQIRQAQQAGQTRPDITKSLSNEVESKLHFDRKVVRAMAPQTGWQLLVWLGVSFTAGFCEEHIFRGYLLAQGRVWMVRLHAPGWLAIVAPIAASSVLFGSLHVYEGAGGAVFIGFLGAAYCVVALHYKNLRAVIIAHTLQDFLAGLILFTKHY